MTGKHVVPDIQQLYWVTTNTHVVSDRQQYDRHTPITSCKRRYDNRCKYFISDRSFNEYSTNSKQPSIPLTNHFRYKLFL